MSNLYDIHHVNSIHHIDGTNLMGTVKCGNCGSPNVVLKEGKQNIWLAGVLFIIVGAVFLPIPFLGIGFFVMGLFCGIPCITMSKKMKHNVLACRHCRNMQKVTLEEAKKIKEKVSVNEQKNTFKY